MDTEPPPDSSSSLSWFHWPKGWRLNSKISITFLLLKEWFSCWSRYQDCLKIRYPPFHGQHRCMWVFFIYSLLSFVWICCNYLYIFGVYIVYISVVYICCIYCVYSLYIFVYIYCLYSKGGTDACVAATKIRMISLASKPSKEAPMHCTHSWHNIFKTLPMLCVIWGFHF